MKVFEGDEWKHVKEPKHAEMKRTEAQEIIDSQYAAGVLTHQEWSDKFDQLSEPTVESYQAVV